MEQCSNEPEDTIFLKFNILLSTVWTSKNGVVKSSSLLHFLNLVQSRHMAFLTMDHSHMEQWSILNVGLIIQLEVFTIHFRQIIQ